MTNQFIALISQCENPFNLGQAIHSIWCFVIEATRTQMGKTLRSLQALASLSVLLCHPVRSIHHPQKLNFPPIPVLGESFVLLSLVDLQED